MQPKSTIFAPLPDEPSRRAAAHKFGGAATAIICCMVLFVVCLAVYVSVNAAPRRPAAPKTAADYKANAISLCRDQMKLELRSPSEATFPGWSSPTVAVYGNEITVRDYVDAPNAFGTPVRTEFACVVELSSDLRRSQITDFDTYPR